MAPKNATSSTGKSLDEGGMIFAVFYIPMFDMFSLYLLSCMASHIHHMRWSRAASASMKGDFTIRLFMALDTNRNDRVERLEVRE